MTNMLKHLTEDMDILQEHKRTGLNERRRSIRDMQRECKRERTAEENPKWNNGKNEKRSNR